jgi:quinol monooxygenase YgiN
MAFMLKIRWTFKPGERAAFEAAQRELCAVMHEHPGVIAYHVTYPDDANSEWTEIYANDAAFRAHLDNPKGKAPLAAAVAACAAIDCRCFGDPDAASREILKGFGTTYHPTADNAFVLHPRADRDSQV